MENAEENQPKQKEESVKLERIFGIALLVPPLIGVLLFLLSLLDKEAGAIPQLRNLSYAWTGNDSGNGGGFTSAAPIYLGLMAIAGALLLKGTDKNIQKLPTTDLNNE